VGELMADVVAGIAISVGLAVCPRANPASDPANTHSVNLRRKGMLLFQNLAVNTILKS
jgi:hypothetical protein